MAQSQRFHTSHQGSNGAHFFIQRRGVAQRTAGIGDRIIDKTGPFVLEAHEPRIAEEITRPVTQDVVWRLVVIRMATGRDVSRGGK